MDLWHEFRLFQRRAMEQQPGVAPPTMEEFVQFRSLCSGGQGGGPPATVGMQAPLSGPVAAAAPDPVTATIDPSLELQSRVDVLTKEVDDLKKRTCEPREDASSSDKSYDHPRKRGRKRQQTDLRVLTAPKVKLTRQQVSTRKQLKVSVMRHCTMQLTHYMHHSHVRIASSGTWATLPATTRIRSRTSKMARTLQRRSLSLGSCSLCGGSLLMILRTN